MYGRLKPGNHELCPNFENIFEFMNGFPVNNTRVVIIGRDPSEKKESSGYAFHGTFCTSTRILAENFQDYDNKFINSLCDIGSKSNIDSPRDRAILDGWIEQG